MSDKKEVLTHLTNNQLMDVYYNFRKYGYPQSYSADARAILLDRGVPEIEFEATEAQVISAELNKSNILDQARVLLDEYRKQNRILLLFYLGQFLLIGILFTPWQGIFPYVYLAYAVGLIVLHLITLQKYHRLNDLLNEEKFHPVVHFVLSYFVALPISPFFNLLQIREFRRRLG